MSGEVAGSEPGSHRTTCVGNKLESFSESVKSNRTTSNLTPELSRRAHNAEATRVLDERRA
jgi:hypothetical protein